MKILVNNENVNFSHDDFPMLVTGVEKSGSSFFSVCLMEKLFEAGEKIIFFSAFPQAKNQFRDGLGDRINSNALIIESGDANVLVEAIQEVDDFKERILLFKNFENYSEEVLNRVKNKKLIIYSGDIDNCKFGNELAEKDFKTKILFSYSDTIRVNNKIELPKYWGHIISHKYNGLITISI